MGTNHEAGLLMSANCDATLGSFTTLASGYEVLVETETLSRWKVDEFHPRRAKYGLSDF